MTVDHLGHFAVFNPRSAMPRLHNEFVRRFDITKNNNLVMNAVRDGYHFAHRRHPAADEAIEDFSLRHCRAKFWSSLHRVVSPRVPAVINRRDIKRFFGSNKRGPTRPRIAAAWWSTGRSGWSK